MVGLGLWAAADPKITIEKVPIFGWCPLDGCKCAQDDAERDMKVWQKQENARVAAKAAEENGNEQLKAFDLGMAQTKATRQGREAPQTAAAQRATLQIQETAAITEQSNLARAIARSYVGLGRLVPTLREQSTTQPRSGASGRGHD